MLNGKEFVWGLKVILRSRLWAYVCSDLCIEMGSQLPNWRVSLHGPSGAVILQACTGHKPGNNLTQANSNSNEGLYIAKH